MVAAVFVMTLPIAQGFQKMLITSGSPDNAITSFSEVAFTFRITPVLMAGGLIFSAMMGTVGGLLPALGAARIPVARALREI